MLRPSVTEHVQDINRSVLLDALVAKAGGDGETFAAGLPQDIRPVILELQDAYDRLLGLLPDYARPAVLAKLSRIVDELVVDGWSPTAAAEALTHYEDVPVSPDVFFSDPYYAGEFGEGLYPVNFRDLCWLANPENRIMETILTGCIRWGKTTLAVYVLTYRLYLLLLLREPSVYFGLARDSNLRYGIFSLYKYKTNEMEERLRTVVDESPYFQQNCPRLNQKQSRQLHFPKHISILIGSTQLHLLGETMVGAVLDEINFMASPKITGKSRAAAKVELGQAQTLYTALRTRLRNQFVKSPGTAVPYFMCLMSERRAQTDFLEQHILEHGHEPGVAVISRAIWDVQPPGTYSGKTFFVFCGDTLNAARMLGPEETPADDTNTVEVPEEHREDFKDNLEDAIRRVAGRATVAASNLFGRPEVIGEAFDEKVMHPFTQEEITLSTGDDTEIASYVREEVLFRHEMSGLQPRTDPGVHRVMHVDLSATTTSTGIACVHMRTEGLDYKVIVDFMLRVNPPLRISGHEIDFEKIITFVRYLQKNGFVFALVSFDKYQSRHSAQILRKSGTEVAYISVDETDDPYVNLRGLFESHRISMYEYPPVVDELRHLEHDITRRKVLKAQNKLKDVADALAGSCFGLIPERTRPRPSKMLEQIATSQAGAAGWPVVPVGG